jgi:hypothetical protein
VKFYESASKGIKDTMRLTPAVRTRRGGLGVAPGFNWLVTEVVPTPKPFRPVPILACVP